MSVRTSSPAGFLFCVRSFCLMLCLLCAFSGCAKTDTSEFASESDIVSQRVIDFGSEGTVVEIYTFRSSVVVVLENDRGDRIRAYARASHTPVKGDRWTIELNGKKTGYWWPYLEQRISD